MPHKPSEQIRILTVEQIHVALFVGVSQRGKFILYKGHQDQIQFKHAPATVPVQPFFIKFHDVYNSEARNESGNLKNRYYIKPQLIWLPQTSNKL